MEFLNKSFIIKVKLNIKNTLNLDTIVDKLNLKYSEDKNGICCIKNNNKHKCTGIHINKKIKLNFLDSISLIIIYEQTKFLIKLFKNGTLIITSVVIKNDQIIEEIIPYLLELIQPLIEFNDYSKIILLKDMICTIYYKFIHSIDINKFSSFFLKNNNDYINKKPDFSTNKTMFINNLTKKRIILSSNLVIFHGNNSSVDNDINNFKILLDNYNNQYIHNPNINCDKCSLQNINDLKSFDDLVIQISI